MEIKETSKYPKYASSNYTECQYHNQLKLEDIKSIHFTPYASSHGSNYEKLNKIIEITRKTHIPIKIFEHK